MSSLYPVLRMQVFYGIPFKGGERILTGVHEYAANYIAFLQVQHSSLMHHMLESSINVMPSNGCCACNRGDVLTSSLVSA